MDNTIISEHRISAVRSKLSTFIADVIIPKIIESDDYSDDQKTALIDDLLDKIAHAKQLKNEITKICEEFAKPNIYFSVGDASKKKIKVSAELDDFRK